MELIDTNVNRENIHTKIEQMKNLIMDLEFDLEEETKLKSKTSIYNSILQIQRRLNNFENKADRWQLS